MVAGAGEVAAVAAGVTACGQGSGVMGGGEPGGGSGPMTALSTCEFGTFSMPLGVASRR